MRRELISKEFRPRQSEAGMSTQGKLVGKRTLVTGSGTGIGREIAREFARHGAAVVLHYSHSDKGAKSALEEIRAAGGKTEVFQADFNSVAEVKRLGRQALEFLGGLDVLVNNAGITMNRPFEQVTPEQYDTLYHVNVRAQFFLTQTVLPALEQSRGTVINLTSIHAFEGRADHAVYGGTKGAIVAFTRSLAIELAPRGIRVNAIAPGAVVVENYYKAEPKGDFSAFGKNIPAGFIGEPIDIARVAVFLASDDARFIVGQTLVVDGGTISWMPFNEGFRRPAKPVQHGRGYVPGL
jgi:NAD(P)-dependent dehydrogenase (short-subunit alcohol dehydrogenase family)